MSQAIIAAQAAGVARQEAQKQVAAFRSFLERSQLKTSTFNWQRVAVRIIATWILGLLFQTVILTPYMTGKAPKATSTAINRIASNPPFPLNLVQYVPIWGGITSFIAFQIPKAEFPSYTDDEIKKEQDSLSILDRFIFTLSGWMTVILIVISAYWIYSEYSRINKAKRIRIAA